MYKKVMIFGRPGSGKSTFALALHKITNLPIHHLDKHFFVSNWVERDYSEFMNVQESIVDADHWIIDGNNTKSLELRYANADLVLYFNLPRWICYFRTFKRLFFKDQNIDDRAEGCEETINLKLLGYMWTFEKRVRDKIVLLRSKYPHVRFIEVKQDAELAEIMGMIKVEIC